MPGKWFPALALVKDIFEAGDFTDEENNLKVKANSEVELSLFRK